MTRRPTPPRTSSRKAFPVVPVVGGIAAIALIVTVVLTFDDGGDDGRDAFGSPTVTGAPLPPFASGVADIAVGSPAPRVAGADFDGEAVALEADGRAKIVIFLAHWCPFCQDEVPVLQRLVDDEALPEGVDLYAIASSTDPMRPNYPPSAWLDREGWTSPVVVDDEVNTVARAFGLNAFPFWVFIAEDGTVFGRMAGAIGADAVVMIAQELAET